MSTTTLDSPAPAAVAPATAATSRHGTQVQFGGLILTFTDQFSYAWNDRGSGGDNDGAFWNPVPPAGFYTAGTLAVGNYNDPNQQQWALCMKAADSDPTALARPLAYDWVWSDWGSGSDDDGSCWRPRPPEGYVALGDVFVSGYDQPSPTSLPVMCVRKDLTGPGAIGSWIYDDRGSGADYDIAVWQILPRHGYEDAAKIMIGANTFAAVNAYDTPPPQAVYVLQLPVPYTTAAMPPVPTLTDYNRPPDTTSPVCDRIVTVPFTAVSDPLLSVHDRVTTTPFYDIERWTCFALQLFDYNQTSSPQHAEQATQVGITSEQSQTFSQSTSVEVSFEAGFEIEGFSSSVSTTITTELGYSSSTTVGEFRNQTVTVHLDTQPNHAAAVWAMKDTFQIARDDGSYLPSTLAFEDNGAFYHSEYPHDGVGAARRRVRFQAKD